MNRQPYIAVSGPGVVDREEEAAAFTAGRLLAEAGAVVLTGGLGGVMAAAAAGATSAGGTAVGLLPGDDRALLSPGHTVGIATGMAEMRNALLLRAVDAVLVVSGSWGTLSEVALAVRTGVPVVQWRGWQPVTDEGVPAPGAPVRADDITEAVAAVLAHAHRREPGIVDQAHTQGR